MVEVDMRTSAHSYSHWRNIPDMVLQECDITLITFEPGVYGPNTLGSSLDDRQGTLYIPASKRGLFEVSGDGVRLRRLELDTGFLRFPIFQPSSARAEKGYLDLSTAMEGHGYAQICVVKPSQVKLYRKCWPGLVFFVLPVAAEERGVGAARFYIQLLAKQLCPASFPFYAMVDDR
ncbi:hypothetical protein T492DRAFT_347429 [Pavlovales sp. CCMP2436]|nr:hypothetical protein T492DRAFT_347429 [Pavlovales sp. CCMP2436]